MATAGNQHPGKVALHINAARPVLGVLADEVDGVLHVGEGEDVDANRGRLRTGTSTPTSMIDMERSGRTGVFPIFGGADDFDLDLLDAVTLDGHIQQLTFRPTLRTW